MHLGIGLYRAQQSPDILAYLMQERLVLLSASGKAIFLSTMPIPHQPLWLHLAT